MIININRFVFDFKFSALSTDSATMASKWVTFSEVFFLIIHDYGHTFMIQQSYTNIYWPKPQEESVLGIKKQTVVVEGSQRI